LNELDNYLPHINLIEDATYKSMKRLDLLNLLARLGAYLEDVCNQTNSVGFSSYVDRTRGSKTFDVEHILSESFVKNKEYLLKEDTWDFESEGEYRISRDSIGGLILLPRGRNRSLKDKSYLEKMPIYSTENILCQSLNETFLKNNPTANDALEKNGIELKSYSYFNKQSILERAKIYQKIASLIWSKDQLNNV
jgi:Protein of unknown function (DUF1524)